MHNFLSVIVYPKSQPFICGPKTAFGSKFKSLMRETIHVLACCHVLCALKEEMAAARDCFVVAAISSRFSLPVCCRNLSPGALRADPSPGRAFGAERGEQILLPGPAGHPSAGHSLCSLKEGVRMTALHGECTG